MSILKLFAIILAFSSYVQAASLLDRLKEYTERKDPDAVKKTEQRLQKMKDLGIDPETNIPRNEEAASTLAEIYVHHLNQDGPEDAAALETLKNQFQILQGWGIPLSTRLVKNTSKASSLEELYVHHLNQGRTARAEVKERHSVELLTYIENSFKKMRALSIPLTTKLFQRQNQASNFSEQFVHYTAQGKIGKAQEKEQLLQKMKELGIPLETPITKHIYHPYNLPELYVFYRKDHKNEGAEELEKHVKDAEELERQIETINALDIPLSTPIAKSKQEAKHLAALQVFYLGTEKLELAGLLLPHLQAMKELGIPLSTPIAKSEKEASTQEEKLVCFAANGKKADAQELAAQIRNQQFALKEKDEKVDLKQEDSLKFREIEPAAKKGPEKPEEK